MLWYCVVPGASVMKRALHSETPSLSIRARAPKLTRQHWTGGSGGARWFVCRTQHTLVQALRYEKLFQKSRDHVGGTGDTHTIQYTYVDLEIWWLTGGHLLTWSTEAQNCSVLHCKTLIHSFKEQFRHDNARKKLDVKKLQFSFHIM